MTLAALEQLLKDTMGLDASSIGRSAIERASRERMSACGAPDLDAYWMHLRTSSAELQELIESVVVPETWFFRDVEAYKALATMVQDELPRRSPSNPLRILSLPCASGEEPYSIVMTLLNGGMSAECFIVNAVDISARTLALARRATYGSNSFRGADLAFREVYFERVASSWLLSDRVRLAVAFRQGNLLDPGFLPGEAIYDLIFCRNLLIYFDRATQDASVAVLRRLLKPDGSLFVGSAESGLLLNHGFASAGFSNAFAFRASPAAAPGRAPSLLPKKIAASAMNAAARAPRTARPPVPSARAVRVAHAQPPPHVASKGDLEAAGRLADQGHLDEAARMCEAHVRTHGVSAQSCQLMGLIRHAAGNVVEAVQYFRKALYLDPHHHEALAHLALLLEKQGDAVGAKALQRRLQRLAAQAEP